MAEVWLSTYHPVLRTYKSNFESDLDNGLQTSVALKNSDFADYQFTGCHQKGVLGQKLVQLSSPMITV